MSQPRRFPAPRWATGLFLVAVVAGCASPRVERPSVLVIVVDALRPDHLGAYGYDRPTSPRLDAFAERSVRFTDAYSVSSWTKPSIPSLFTSLYPSQHGVFEGNARTRGGRLESDVLPESAWTLGEAFAACGYSAGGFVHNEHLRAEFGFDQGFARYDLLSSSAPELVDRLLEWMPQDPSSEPFFAYLHLLDVHWPYEPSERSRRDLGVSDTDVEPDRRMRDEVNDGQRTLSAREVGQLVALYDAGIRDVDRALGQLFDRLEERGLLRRMAVIVTADHGEEFLEHDYLGHGNHLYEPSLRVPLLLRLPDDAFAGRVVERRASLVDVMPTALEIAGCEFDPVAFAGRSLIPAADSSEAESAESAPVFAELKNGPTHRQALWSGKWKVIRTTRDPRAEIPRALSSGVLQAPEELIGARVEIEGARVGAAGFRVDEIEVESPDDRDDEIRAALDAVDPARRRIELGGFEVDLTHAVLMDHEGRIIGPDRLRPGVTVKVDGVASGPFRLEADKLRIDRKRSGVQVEGLVLDARVAGPGRIELQLVGLSVEVDARRVAEAVRRCVADDPDRDVRAVPTVAYELYDLEADPGETFNRADIERERVAALVGRLDALAGEIAAGRLSPVARKELDSRTADELRGLGYLR